MRMVMNFSSSSVHSTSSAVHSLSVLRKSATRGEMMPVSKVSKRLASGECRRE